MRALPHPLCLAVFMASFFLSCLLSAAAFAQTADKAQIGTIIEIEGTGQILSNQTPYDSALTTIMLSPEKYDLPVYQNDTIETGADSRAVILLIDDTEITLGENASLKIDEYIFDPEYADANAGRFSVLEGAFLFVSGLLGKKEQPDVQVDTSYGTIGIRGTKFWGGMVGDEYGVLVEEGEVSVQTGRGRINVGSGLGTTIRSSRSIPLRAHMWSPEKTEQARQKVAVKRKEAVARRIAQKKETHGALRAKHREQLKARFQRLREERKNAPPVYQRQKINKPFDHYLPPVRDDQGGDGSTGNDNRGQLREKRPAPPAATQPAARPSRSGNNAPPAGNRQQQRPVR